MSIPRCSRRSCGFFRICPLQSPFALFDFTVLLPSLFAARSATMSSDDDADTLQDRLKGVVDLAEGLPSATPSQAASPTTRRANRDLINQLQERMIQAGQLEPPSVTDALDNVALYLGGMTTPTSSQPLPPAIRDSTEIVMTSIKRVTRKRATDEDVDEGVSQMFEEMDSVVASVNTPSSSQPPTAETLQRGNEALKKLTEQMVQKGIIARNTRRPNKKKVDALLRSPSAYH